MMKEIIIVGLVLPFIFFKNAYSLPEYNFEVIGKNGYIASPNFPRAYPKNISCLWNITVGEGYELNITFVFFDLEKSAGCIKDSLEIKVSNSSWTKYCSYIPDHFISQTGFVLIRFMSDASNESTGFNLTWIAYKQQYTANPSYAYTLPTTAAKDKCIAYGTKVKTTTTVIPSCSQTTALPQVSLSWSSAIYSITEGCDCELTRTNTMSNQPMAASQFMTLSQLKPEVFHPLTVASFESSTEKHSLSSHVSSARWTGSDMVIFTFSGGSSSVMPTSHHNSDVLINHCSQEEHSLKEKYSPLIAVFGAVSATFFIAALIVSSLLYNEMRANRIDVQEDD